MNLKLKIDHTSPLPLYAQLERELRAKVALGALRPGDQLPTVRQLAVDLRINANTVAKVYAELERSGVVETRRGVGTFVIANSTPDRSRAERTKELRALGNRFLAEAAALGFTLDEIIAQLKTRQT